MIIEGGSGAVQRRLSALAQARRQSVSGGMAERARMAAAASRHRRASTGYPAVGRSPGSRVVQWALKAAIANSRTYFAVMLASATGTRASPPTVNSTRTSAAGIS